MRRLHFGFRLLALVWLGVSLSSASPSHLGAEETLRGMGVNAPRADVWTRFADSLVESHRRNRDRPGVIISEKIDGFAKLPDFYREERIADKASGRLLSMVQWLTADPAKAYAVEAYVYDANGRLLRDYRATYLPHHRNAPVQTLVNLHGGEKGLAAFRQFDASGDFIYEACRGTWFGKDVALSIDEPTIGTPQEVRESEEYIACFGMLPSHAGIHVDPRTMLPSFRDEASSAGVPTSHSTPKSGSVAGLTTLLALNPRKASLYMKRGQAHLENQDFEEAIADFTRAIDLDPSLDDAYFGRGMALGRVRRMAEGITDLTVFLKRNPTSSVGYTKRGVRQIWAGNYSEAEQDLREAIRLDPLNGEAHDDLGVLLARRGLIAEAIRHFETTIRVEPSYQKAYHNLGLALHMAGRDLEALAAIDRGQRLQKGPRSSLILKAAVLMALGRTEDARRIEAEAARIADNNWTERLSVK